MVFGQVGQIGQIVQSLVVVVINLELEHAQTLPHNTMGIYARLMDPPIEKIKIVTPENAVRISSMEFKLSTNKLLERTNSKFKTFIFSI